MGRKATPPIAPTPDGTTTEILQSKGMALATQAQHSQAVAATFGDGVAYERERLVSQARRRTFRAGGDRRCKLSYTRWLWSRRVTTTRTGYRETHSSSL